MKVLLAIDGSGHGEAAIDEVVRRHFPIDSEVRVLSVVVPPYYYGATVEGGGDLGLYAEIEKDARARAHAAVDKAAAKLRANEVNVSTKVLAGPAKSVILDEAEAFGADLIVVGSHGHGKLELFLLGSVAHAVALHAKCSVEIVRSPKAATEQEHIAAMKESSVAATPAIPMEHPGT